MLQGFAWRSDSTSFRTIVDAAVYDVEIYVLNKQGLVRKNAVRVIEVPFTIPPNEAIEVASISDAFNLNLPPGKFLLRCEFLDKKTPGVEHVIFTFSVQDAPKYAVLVADELITVTSNFLIDACAAGS